jgi:glycine/D-amino acid oxidase-like deaminating enzyme
VNLTWRRGRAPDVAVVGGGVLGRAVAVELVRSGMRVTQVFPHGHGRDCATLAAGAMIGAFGELMQDRFDDADRRRLAFRVRAQDMHPAWLDRLREESGRELYTTSGMFMIANAGGRDDRRHLRHVREQLDAYERPAEWVPPRDVPGLRPHDAFRASDALFVPQDLTVDSAQLLDALGAVLERSGRGRVVHDRVVGLDPEPAGRGWSVRTARSGPCHAASVVVCAGARVPAVLGERTLRRLRLPTLYFAKGIGVLVNGAPALPHAIRTPNRSDACGLHVVPRAGGRLYIGASNHFGYATAAARGVTPGEVTAILGSTIREIDGTLRDATIERVRFGLRPVSDAGMPLVGPTGLPGLHLATATFRTGIVMAPLIARIVAAGVAGASAEDNPFRPPEPVAGRDLNVAILHADRGLAHYTRARLTGRTEPLRRALAAWQVYMALAGDAADARIVDLVRCLEAGAEPIPHPP